MKSSTLTNLKIGAIIFLIVYATLAPIITLKVIERNKQNDCKTLNTEIYEEQQ